MDYQTKSLYCITLAFILTLAAISVSCVLVWKYQIEAVSRCVTLGHSPIECAGSVYQGRR